MKMPKPNSFEPSAAHRAGPASRLPAISTAAKLPREPVKKMNDERSHESTINAHFLHPHLLLHRPPEMTGKIAGHDETDQIGMRARPAAEAA